MSLFVQTLVNGLLIGGLYVAIAVGFSLAFGVLDVVDFAVGEWVMVGGFVGYGLSTWAGVNLFVLLPAALVIFAVVGYVLAPLVYRVRTSNYARPALMALAFTFGVATLMRGGALTLWGFNPRVISSALAGRSLVVGGIVFPSLRLVAFVLALVAVALFIGLLFYTRTGLAIRATAQDKQNAGLMGINVKQVSALVYAIYAGLTGMVGVLLAAIYSVNAEVGVQYTLLAFFVVVLGGLGSILGALIAGLFLGVLQALVTVYFSADYTLLVVFAILYLVLLVSPRGILGRGAA